MNWVQIEGSWKQAMAKVKQKWAKLTDDDVLLIRGKRDQLVGKIQERYGIAKDAAEHQVDEFIRTYETAPSGTREEEKKRGRGANTRCRPFHAPAFGELVALLWAAGRPEEAVRV